MLDYMIKAHNDLCEVFDFLKFEYYLNKNVHEALKVAPLEYKYLGGKRIFWYTFIVCGLVSMLNEDKIQWVS